MFSKKSVLTIIFIIMILICFTTRPGVFAKSNDMDNDEEVCMEFTELWMQLEQNATDGDTEVVLFAKGQDVGLNKFQIRRPDGQIVAKFKGDKKGIGIREFHLESAEPPELEKILNSFPEGLYQFLGYTVDGECLRGEAFLSHEIAPASKIITPEEDAILELDEVVVSWEEVPEAVVYIIEVKNEESENALLVQVPVPNTSFDVPMNWLEPDVEYQVAVGVRTATGNITNVESAFFTAP